MQAVVTAMLCKAVVTAVGDWGRLAAFSRAILDLGITKIRI